MLYLQRGSDQFIVSTARAPTDNQCSQHPHEVEQITVILMHRVSNEEGLNCFDDEGEESNDCQPYGCFIITLCDQFKAPSGSMSLTG